jgi:hypothetical protein
MARKPREYPKLSRPELLALVERILDTGGKNADIELFIANCKHPAGTDLIFWPHGDTHDPSKPEPTAEEIVEKAMSGEDGHDREPRRRPEL